MPLPSRSHSYWATLGSAVEGDASRVICGLGAGFWGVAVIGMTAATEAKLAREAEIAYAVIAMVTDFDCWHDEHGPVDVASVMKVMHDNSERANRLVPRDPLANVIVVTAFGQSAIEKVCPPVVHVIEKPFDLNALVAEATACAADAGA